MQTSLGSYSIDMSIRSQEIRDGHLEIRDGHLEIRDGHLEIRDTRLIASRLKVIIQIYFKFYLFLKINL